MDNYKRMTLKELEPIVKDYKTFFPDWFLISKETLARLNDPVLQCIAFDRLSLGNYRPMTYIRILIAPQETVGGADLVQFLSVGNRQVFPEHHAQRRDKILEAMRKEWVPSVTRPLDPREVLNLYEKMAAPTAAEAYSLATFNAYLGKPKRALHWSREFNKLVEKQAYPWQSWDQYRRAFLDKLEQWIREGSEKQHLEEVLQQERQKLKI